MRVYNFGVGMRNLTKL